MKYKLLDTTFATLAGLKAHSSRNLKYLLENRNYILSLEEVVQLTMSVRNILRTPIAECFDRMIDNGQLNNFAVIYIPTSRQGTSVPELLSTTSITLDLKELPDEHGVLRSLPELQGKILINLSGILKENRTYGGYTVSAIDTFQSLFVRGQMVASYHDSDDWLTPYLAEYAIKSYSMVLSSMISRYYDLSLAETNIITTILALYMAQRFKRDTESNSHPNIMYRLSYLGNQREIQMMLDRFEEVSHAGLTTESVAQLIVEHSPDRLKSFSPKDLTTFGARLSTDDVCSRIAMEHPAYWVWSLVTALSVTSIPLLYQLNSNKLANEGRSKFLQQLYSYDKLYNLGR